MNQSYRLSYDETLFLSYQKLSKLKLHVFIKKRVISIDWKNVH